MAKAVDDKGLHQGGCRIYRAGVRQSIAFAPRRSIIEYRVAVLLFVEVPTHYYCGSQVVPTVPSI